MLFSCLVDADVLSTRAFEEGRERAAAIPLLELQPAFTAYMAGKTGEGELNRLRRAVLNHALGRAALDPGLFTLTVPTGGGKTLASLALADRPAVPGGVHGGFIAAMLDGAAGMGARLSLNPATVLPSLDFRVSFLAPAPAGTLFAETRCLHVGRRVAFLEADLLHNDKLLARMNVTSIVVEGSPGPAPEAP